MQPFLWIDDATLKIDVTTSSANGALIKAPNYSDFQIRVYNAGTVPVFIQKGSDSSTAATTADMPIAPGSVEVLTVRNPATSPVSHIAAICSSSTSTLYITTGKGI